LITLLKSISDELWKPESKVKVIFHLYKVRVYKGASWEI